MSFVNLMAHDIWSEQDIINRTEAIIRGEFPTDAENILNRKVTAAIMGVYNLTDAEKAEVSHYQTICAFARDSGMAARADMTLLTNVLTVEAAATRLAQPVLNPVLDETGKISNQTELDNDASERVAAQTSIDGANADVNALLSLRNPIVEVDNGLDKTLSAEPVGMG